MKIIKEPMGYTELLTYYNENKNKPFKAWLEFDGFLPSQGKQGMIGLFRRPLNVRVGLKLYKLRSTSRV